LPFFITRILKNLKMKIVRTISRIILGLVFILSGFVKGVDPLGTAYKIEDYFIAFGTDWAIPLALSLAVILCVAEFSLGVFLLFNIFSVSSHIIKRNTQR